MIVFEWPNVQIGIMKYDYHYVEVQLAKRLIARPQFWKNQLCFTFAYYFDCHGNPLDAQVLNIAKTLKA